MTWIVEPDNDTSGSPNQPTTNWLCGWALVRVIGSVLGAVAAMSDPCAGSVFCIINSD
jgi:hypothetical protein